MISLFFDDLPHSLFLYITFLWEHSHAHLVTYDEGCPGLQGQNWVGITETSLWPTKRKVFTIWPFREKVCWPLRERIRAWVLIWSFSQPLPTPPISSSFQLLQTPTALSQALLLKTLGSWMGTFSPHIRDIFLPLTWYKSIHHFKFNSKVMFSLHLSWPTQAVLAPSSLTSVGLCFSADTGVATIYHHLHYQITGHLQVWHQVLLT